MIGNGEQMSGFAKSLLANHLQNWRTFLSRLLQMVKGVREVDNRKLSSIFGREFSERISPQVQMLEGKRSQRIWSRGDLRWSPG
jgi:hypothetical protein